MSDPIEMSGMPFSPGDVVLVTYIWRGSDGDGDHTEVGRYLSEKEASSLNRGENPWEPTALSRVRVRRPVRKVHFFPECGGRKHKTLSRSIQATTCKHCLMKRARALRGWRWSADYNQSEVAFLTQSLGSRVEGLAEPSRGMRDRLHRLRREVSDG